MLTFRISIVPAPFLQIKWISTATKKVISGPWKKLRASRTWWLVRPAVASWMFVVFFPRFSENPSSILKLYIRISANVAPYFRAPDLRTNPPQFDQIIIPARKLVRITPIYKPWNGHLGRGREPYLVGLTIWLLTTYPSWDDPEKTCLRLLLHNPRLIPQQNT